MTLMNSQSARAGKPAPGHVRPENGVAQAQLTSAQERQELLDIPAFLRDIHQPRVVSIVDAIASRAATAVEAAAFRAAHWDEAQS